MAIPSLADEIRAYIETGALPEVTLDYALRRWARRAAALAQIRDELLQIASKADRYRFALYHVCVLVGLALYLLDKEDVKGAHYYTREAYKVIMEALETGERTEKAEEA
jgi:hypothetical protein